MTAAERIAEIEARRAKQREAEADAHTEQLAVDLEALEALENEHGHERVLRINIRGWRPGEGAATMVVARIPRKSDSLFKRYEDSVVEATSGKNGGAKSLKAGEMLARSCIVYPSEKEQPDLYAATMDLAAGILMHVTNEMIKACQGRAEEEKNG